MHSHFAAVFVLAYLPTLCNLASKACEKAFCVSLGHGVPVSLALHVNCVRARGAPRWLLDPFSFLQGCPRCRCDALCSVFAADLLLVLGLLLRTPR
jgi:hypothetical protein